MLSKRWKIYQISNIYQLWYIVISCFFLFGKFYLLNFSYPELQQYGDENHRESFLVLNVLGSEKILLESSEKNQDPMDTGRKSNVPKTFKRRPYVCPMYVLCPEGNSGVSCSILAILNHASVPKHFCVMSSVQLIIQHQGIPVCSECNCSVK